MKWVFIGAVLVILMVAFGRNPIEEGREKREKAKEGKDPLMMSIQEYHKESKQNARGTVRTNREKLPEGAEKIPDYSKPGRGGSMYNNVPGPQDAQPQKQPQGYYPPPAKGGASSPRSQGPSGIDQNRKISFYGTRAYTTDEHGKKVLLPDGKHPIFGGKLYLIIEGGEKVGVAADGSS